MAIIHLGISLPKCSSDLPENAISSFNKTLSRLPKNRFPIWSCTTRSLPSRICYQTRWCALTAPFHPLPLQAGLLSVALVVVKFKLHSRTLSGSLPSGVRTFLFN